MGAGAANPPLRVGNANHLDTGGVAGEAEEERLLGACLLASLLACCQSNPASGRTNLQGRKEAVVCGAARDSAYVRR